MSEADEDVKLSFRERLSIKLQRIIGWITFPLWGVILIFLIRFLGRYRADHLSQIRKRYLDLVNSTQGPILICANHLTKIDSVIINWILASMWSYIRSFRLFPWNMPERSRYEGNIFLRTICYLGSCIPVDRGGDRDAVAKSLGKITYLLKKGDPIMIFPEGKRSRDGKLDVKDFSYGAGRLFRAAEGCTVLCVYLRGYSQKRFGGMPRFGEKFYFDMQLIKPESVHEGLRATRDIASQIIKQLQHMEQGYFAACRQ